MVWTETHVPGWLFCFFPPLEWLSSRIPLDKLGLRPQHNRRLCAWEPSDTRAELGFGGLFRLIKRDVLLFMQARETVLGAEGTPAALEFICIHVDAEIISSHAEIHLMLRCM